MKVKTKVQRKPRAKKVSEFKASIKVFGKVFTATGSTVKEAIENLKPGVARGMSVLTVSGNGINRDRILSPVQTFRLFTGSRLMREIAIKNVSMLF